MFEALVIAGVVLATVFLFVGLSVSVFGNKVVGQETNSQRLEFKVLGNTISMPYRTGALLCFVGVILLFLTFDLYKNAGSPGMTGHSGSVMSAYAQDRNDATEGWVYFGYEKAPRQWNFSFVSGDYDQLRENPENVVLQSVGNVYIREDHFGNLTGTILGFLSPAPKKIGVVDRDQCVRVLEATSVGFDKVWLHVKIVRCPGSSRK